MASYFNITLDTIGPSGVEISLNDGALYTTSTSVILKITTNDESTTGYQMKIWGIASSETEDDAQYETFVSQKTVVLSSGDGLKTVHVKLRDDVGNESIETTDDITLNTALPAVTITGPDKNKISKIEGFNKAVISFTSDVSFIEYKICVVPAIDSLESAGSTISTAGGSINTSGTGTYEANTPISVTISGADLESASVGDGTKIVKVFVKSDAGFWSVA